MTECCFNSPMADRMKKDTVEFILACGMELTEFQKTFIRAMESGDIVYNPHRPRPQSKSTIIWGTPMARSEKLEGRRATVVIIDDVQNNFPPLANPFHQKESA